MRHPRILDRDKAVLFVVDVQDRFSSHIFEFEEMCKNIEILIKAANILKVPVVVTEQYPKGLGKTVSRISSCLEEHLFFEKNCFSSCGVDELSKWLKDSGRNQIILTGIETHVCVNQTAHDLLKSQYIVHLVKDAVSSRDPKNKETGIEKIVTAGGVPTCVEAAMFEMLVESGTADFKACQQLVK